MIARHYGIPGLLDVIRGALQAQGKDLERLTSADLAPVDEFHVRGRHATAELAELAGACVGLRALDAGSGLGGSARFLASECGCSVTGVDLTPEYCEAARSLSQLVALDGRTKFCCASAVATPFRDATFDLVWTEHAQMNIPDKPDLYQEFHRVLRPGGRFVFHDVLVGPAGAPHFPAPWAAGPAQSFLIAPQELRDLLERTGFRLLAWMDRTDAAHQWCQALLQQWRQTGVPTLGTHLLMGDAAAMKFENLCRNLSESRITVFQGLLERP